MIYLERFLGFVISLAVGIYFILRAEPLVRLFGHNELAERYLGRGGSYLFWKLLGIALIIIGCLFLVGTMDVLFRPAVPLLSPPE